MDSWSDRELKIMRIGGNARMKDFFKQQRFPPNLSIEDKYNAPVVELYRENIKLEADGQSPKPIPFMGYTPSTKSLSVQNRKQLSHMSPDNHGNDDSPSYQSSLDQSRGRTKMESYGSQPLNNTSNAFSDWGSILSTVKSTALDAGSALAANTAKVATAVKQRAAEVDSRDLQAKASSGWSSFAGFLSSAVNNVASRVAGDSSSEGFAIPRPENQHPGKQYESMSSEAFVPSITLKKSTGAKFAAMGSDSFQNEDVDDSGPNQRPERAANSKENQASNKTPAITSPNLQSSHGTFQGWDDEDPNSSNFSLSDSQKPPNLAPSSQIMPSSSSSNVKQTNRTTSSAQQESSHWNDDDFGFDDSEDDTIPVQTVKFNNKRVK